MPINFKISFILFLLFSIPAFGQVAPQSAESHGVLVVDMQWALTRKTVFVKPSTISKGKEEIVQAQRARGTSSQDQKTLASGKSITVPRQSTEGVVTKEDIGKTATVTVYLYKTTVKNDGQKTIKEITWEYVFLDPLTKKELGRRQFTSQKTISPGKQKTLDERSALPPTNVITADSAGSNLGNHYLEEIQIKNVKYSDGSIWEYAAP